MTVTKNPDRFTCVPRGSFEALVLHGWLTEVVLALVTDPLEAQDLSEEVGPPVDFMGPCGQKLIRQTEEGSFRVVPSSLDVYRMGASMVDAWRLTMSQWVTVVDDPRSAMEGLMSYEIRIGTWCSSQLMRSLFAASATEVAEWVGILDHAEAWVRREATEDSLIERGGKADEDAYASLETELAARVAWIIGSANVVDMSKDSVRMLQLYGELAEPEFRIAATQAISNACLSFPVSDD